MRGRKIQSFIAHVSYISVVNNIMRSNSAFQYVLVDLPAGPHFCDFFLRITQYIGDTHNARTLIPMNTRTQMSHKEIKLCAPSILKYNHF
jgi:hypothetical protein